MSARLTFATLLAVALATTVLPAAEARAPAERYAASAFVATNAERADRDQVRLRPDRCLERFAVAWAKRMARTERLVHQSLTPIARRCGLSGAGENIAYGFTQGRAVVRGWMNSPGHRENILRPEFRLMAIGAARDADGRWWSSQVFGRR